MREKKLNIIWAVLLLCLFPAMVFADDETESAKWFDTITVNGFVSGAYSFNFNDPESDTNQFRVFDFDDMDTLKAVVSSMPPEVAAKAESHGVIMPMTVYVEP